MPEKPKKTPCCLGLLAHVDAGKTTLSEGLLYVSGARRSLGRVDHQDAFLDTDDLERARGITIFSKQARLETATRSVTLVDTPGHVDFSAETERVLPCMDCAVLVISGTDGVQAHTLTLWHLLEQYRVPVFLFVNKLDLPGPGKQALLSQLQAQLSSGCLDFTTDFSSLAENAALCDEALLENYLESGVVTQGNLRELISGRKIFPCLFGSALHLQGVRELLDALDQYAPVRAYPDDFGALVYKISRDPQGNRLTWMKITGGSLQVRDTVAYRTRMGEDRAEKIAQIRLYSGEKFTAAEAAESGSLIAVMGLTQTYAGQALGRQSAGADTLLEPIMTYRIRLPAGVTISQALPKLRQLEEEDPQLHLTVQEDVLHIQLMGKVQLEIFRAVAQSRFGLDLDLDDSRVYYKETITAPVEGVGHYEPLRHYAEVHLLLEPLPRGSGLRFGSVCSTDVLDGNYQNLILTHLAEKCHRGVLTGAPITDMKITLLVGKAHLKHTEGGDFRQATYRAVRQGLMQAESILLEPWYDFVLTVPTEQIGRAITDIRTMSGSFDAPETAGSASILRGTVPASQVGDYADILAAYTQGRGRLQLSLGGYQPCHNAEAVIRETGYDPEGDLENSPDSIFCAHGAGFPVKWNQVKEFMHLDSGLTEKQDPQIITRNLRADDRELEKIMEREFGPIRRPQYASSTNRPATEEIVIRPPKQKYILVDGYNMIFAWEELAETAKTDLDAARRQLCDQLSSYAGFSKCRLVVVFDGYKRRGNPGEKFQFHNIQVVYTREGETADAYMASLSHEIGSNYAVWVASSDALVQLSGLGGGILRMSARELRELVEQARKDMRRHYSK